VLLSTHNLDEVERVADRVAVLKTRLVALDTPGALRTRLFGARVRVTMAQRAELFVAALPGFDDVKADGMTLSIAVPDHAAAAPAIVRQLVAAGAEIQSVVPEEAPLEEVYVRLIDEAGQ
jgi:ABC-2 type transport system ATP-binding protein